MSSTEQTTFASLRAGFDLATIDGTSAAARSDTEARTTGAGQLASVREKTVDAD
jgi:hypothetical protein